MTDTMTMERLDKTIAAAINRADSVNEVKDLLAIAILARSAIVSPQCCVCGKTDLSIVEGDGGTECQLADGRWVCSQDCYDRALVTRDGEAVAWQWQNDDGTWVLVRDKEMADACQSLFDSKGQGKMVIPLYTHSAHADRDALEALREALAKAEYQPGDSPVVPVKIATFMDFARSILKGEQE